MMLKTLRAAVLTAFALAVFSAAPAMAQTISQTNNTGVFGFGDGSQTRFAQVVTAPNERITALSIVLSGLGSGGTVTPQIFAFSGSALVGPAIYTGTPFTPTSGNATYTVPVGSVPVTIGNQYALVFTATGDPANFPFGTPDALLGSTLHFAVSPTATTFQEISGRDAVFSVTFSAAPVIAPIPTMSEWAMIFFGIILAGSAALYLQRRQMSA